MQKQKVKKYLKINFDMIQSDKEFYLANCNFDEEQEMVFKALTGKTKMSIVQIAMKYNMCDRKVSKIIKQIKLKMIKVLIFKN